MKKIKLLTIIVLFITIGFKIEIFANEKIENINKNILIINSYDSENIWEGLVLKGFQDEIELNKKYGINLNVEYLDSKKRSDEEYIKKFRSLLESKYNDINIDLIVSVDDESFNLLREEIFNKSSVFYNKPLIFIGVNQKIYLSEKESKYISGFIDIKSKLQIVDVITKLQPKVKSINFLLDDTFYNEKIKKDIMNSSYLLDNKVKINFIQDSYEEEILSKVKNMNKDEVIVIAGVFKQKQNNAYINPKEFVKHLKQNTNACLYTDRQDYIDCGVIGGYIDVGEKNGQSCAKMALKILDGEKVENINLINEPSGEYVFDYNEIYKNDIDISKIPRSSTILNKGKYELLLTKQERAFIKALLIVIVITTAIIIYVMIISRKNSIKNKQLYVIAKEREQLKTDFIVNMSHELRTPLNVIISISKLLEIKVNKNEIDKEYLLEKINRINQNSSRLTRLINNLIDISKFEAGFYESKFEEANIVYVIEEVVAESVDFANQKEIELIFDTEEEEIITYIDIEKIERVILNLLSNAIKFTNKNGKIEVIIKRIKENVIILVKDNGIGIKKDKVEQIFHRFYQIDSSLSRSNEGSGIGLCIVEEIVKMHKGTISVYSQENKGSTFEIILPITHLNKVTESKSIKNIGFKENVKLEMSDIDK